MINGDGGLFVAMPSVLLLDKCWKCQRKNLPRAVYCSWCGERLGDNIKSWKDSRMDMVFPINTEGRKIIHESVINAYNLEKHR